jgi:hypothetical protein
MVVEVEANNNILRATVHGRMSGAILSEFYAATAKYMVSTRSRYLRLLPGERVRSFYRAIPPTRRRSTRMPRRIRASPGNTLKISSAA